MNKKGLLVIFIVVLTGILLSGCQMEKEATKIGDITTASDPTDVALSDPVQEYIYEVGDIIKGAIYTSRTFDINSSEELVKNFVIDN